LSEDRLYGTLDALCDVWGRRVLCGCENASVGDVQQYGVADFISIVVVRLLYLNLRVGTTDVDSEANERH
jgi:hypothetical protein